MAVKAAELQVVVGADTSQAEAGLQSFSGKLGGIVGGIGKLAAAGVAAGVGAIGAGMVAATVAATGFEKSISGIGAVAGATAEEMGQVSKLALQLGKDTSFSASEAAAGIEELVKGGLTLEDIFAGGAKAALDLAAAGAVSVADAAEIAANAVGQFGLKGAELGHAADLIAGAANASSLSVTDFKFSLAAVGAVANTVGLTFDDTAVAIAEMGKAGIKSSDAGTSLKAMLLNLQPATKKASAEFRALGLITEDGSNQFFDAAGNVKSLAEIQGVLQKATAGLTKQQKLASLEIIFGSDAIRAAAVLANEGAEGYDAMAAAMGKVTAADVARERLNNLAGSIDQLTGSLATAAISVGLRFTPALKGLADDATKAVNAAIPELERLADTAVTAGTTFVQALKGDWRPDGVDESGNIIWIDPFVSEMGKAGLAVKGFFDAFASPEVAASSQHTAENMRDLNAELDTLVIRFGGVKAPAFDAGESVKAFHRELESLSGMAANAVGLLNTMGDAFGAFGAGVALSAKAVQQVFTGDWMGAAASVNAAAAEFDRIPGILDAHYQKVQERMTAAAPEIAAQARDTWYKVPTEAQAALDLVPPAVDATMVAADASLAAGGATLTATATAQFDAVAATADPALATIPPVVDTQMAAADASAAAGGAAIVTTLTGSFGEAVGVAESEMPKVPAAVQAQDRPARAAAQALGSAIVAGISPSWNELTAAAGSAGSGMVNAFAAGVRANLAAAKAEVIRMVNEIRSLLPGSDAKTGPLSDLTESGKALPATFGAGIAAGAGRATEPAVSMAAGVAAPVQTLAQQPNLARLIAAPPVVSDGGARIVNVTLQNYGYLGSQSDFDTLLSESVRRALDDGTF